MASHHLIVAFFLSPCVVVDDVLRSNDDQAGNQVGRYPPIDNAYWPPAPAPAGASSSSGGFGPPLHIMDKVIGSSMRVRSGEVEPR